MATEAAHSARDSVRTLELKGRMLLVSVLRVHTAQADALDASLQQRMAEAPELMRDMPIVVDIEDVAEAGLADLLILIERIRSHGYKLIGIQQHAAPSQALAEASGLPLLVIGGGRASNEPIAKENHPESANREPVREPTPVATVHTATRIVNQPVRSGQQVYARGGDLIIIGSVSAGAEVLADGHIHIHGNLRGRALAGVRGLVSARIYCRRLDAELISIAGHYRIADDLADQDRGENRLISLEQEALHIAEV